MQQQLQRRRQQIMSDCRGSYSKQVSFINRWLSVVWVSKLISNVLLWSSTHRHNIVGRPAKTLITSVCVCVCIYIYIYIYIYLLVFKSMCIIKYFKKRLKYFKNYLKRGGTLCFSQISFLRILKYFNRFFF